MACKVLICCRRTPYTLFRRPIYISSAVSAGFGIGNPSSSSTAIAVPNQISALALRRSIPASVQLYQRSFHLSNVKEKAADNKSFVLVNPLSEKQPSMYLVLIVTTVILGIKYEQSLVLVAQMLDQYLDILGKLDFLLSTGYQVVDYSANLLKKLVADLPNDCATVLKTLLITNGLGRVYQLLFSKKSVSNGGGGSGGTGCNGGGDHYYGDFFGDIHLHHSVIYIQNFNAYKLEKEAVKK